MIKIKIIGLDGHDIWVDTNDKKVASKIEEYCKQLYQAGYRSGMEDGQSLKSYSPIRRTYAWVGFTAIILAIAYLINN